MGGGERTFWIYILYIYLPFAFHVLFVISSLRLPDCPTPWVKEGLDYIATALLVSPDVSSSAKIHWKPFLIELKNWIKKYKYNFFQSSLCPSCWMQPPPQLGSRDRQVTPLEHWTYLILLPPSYLPHNNYPVKVCDWSSHPASFHS